MALRAKPLKIEPRLEKEDKQRRHNKQIIYLSVKYLQTNNCSIHQTMLPIIILPSPKETTVQSQNFHAILEVKAQRTQTNKPGVAHFVG